MNWLRKWFGGRATKAPAAHRVRSCRPRLEALETRDVPTGGIAVSYPAGEFLNFYTHVGQTVTESLVVTDTDPRGFLLTVTFNWGDGTAPHTFQVAGDLSAGVLVTDSHTYTIPSPDLFYVHFSAKDLDNNQYSDAPYYTFAGLVDPALPAPSPPPAPAAPPPSAAPAVPAIQDVTPEVQLFQLKRKFDSFTGRTSLTLLLVNTSGEPIQGPLYLELGYLRHGINLRNRTGFAAAHPPGGPYVTLPADQLAPGQGTIITLNFSNSAGQPVKLSSFVPTVLAGPGQV